MRLETYYLTEHIAPYDVEFILDTLVPARAERDRARHLLSASPDLVEPLLDDERLFRRLFTDEEAILRLSPYVIFAILLRQARRDLGALSYTTEWAGSRSRVPVFDAAAVRASLEDSDRLAYLAELLASFSRVGHVTVRLRQGRKIRRLRVHELDPPSLGRLADLLPEEERFFLWRRLGDAALFLAGIFADHVANPVRGTAPPSRFLAALPPGLAAIEFLEELGSRHYRLAADHPGARRTGLHPVLASLAGDFHGARKVLGFLGDRYLHRFRAAWFPPVA